MRNKIKLIPLLVFFSITACNGDNKREMDTVFLAKVEEVKKNGYAVDFADHSDVFDLAILKIVTPKGFAGEKMQMVLDDNEIAPAFVEGEVLSFRLGNDVANAYFEKIKTKSSLNLVYSSFIREIQNLNKQGKLE